MAYSHNGFDFQTSSENVGNLATSPEAVSMISLMPAGGLWLLKISFAAAKGGLQRLFN